jgi:hypothetical protein
MEQIALRPSDWSMGPPAQDHPSDALGSPPARVPGAAITLQADRRRRAHDHGAGAGGAAERVPGGSPA